MHHDQVLQLLVFALILDLELCQSVVVLSTQFQLQVHLSCQFLSYISQKHSQVVSFPVVCSHGVFELGSKSLEVGFVQLRDFDLHELNFSFIMKHEFLNLSFQLVIIVNDII